MGFLPDLWILAGNQTSLRCSPQVPDYHPPQIGRCSPAAPGHPQGVALLYTTPLYAERGHVYSRATPIGVNLSPCEGQAGHPQGVALLYTMALQATRTPRIIVGPPLAGGLRRSIYDGSTGGANAASRVGPPASRAGQPSRPPARGGPTIRRSSVSEYIVYSRYRVKSQASKSKCTKNPKREEERPGRRKEASKGHS